MACVISALQACSLVTIVPSDDSIKAGTRQRQYQLTAYTEPKLANNCKDNKAAYVIA